MPGESSEQPGQSCFLRVGDDVFHTYSSFARGAEPTGGSYYFLDETALGRQEEWEEPKGRADDARRGSRLLELTENDAAMATYVLIHGAGSDSWYWHLVVPELRARATTS